MSAMIYINFQCGDCTHWFLAVKKTAFPSKMKDANEILSALHADSVSHSLKVPAEVQ